MASNIQTLRLRPKEDPKPPVTRVARHTGILQDQLRRSARKPWNPNFSTAVRILLLIRVAAAMYSNIQDCDEVFNFWEPLHYIDHGHGFQTWEVTPTYAIRSWAYVLLHLIPARLPSILRLGKRPAFFAVRITIAVLSTLCEAKLCRTVVEKVNERVGRYLFFMLLFSAGMWNAAPAFLPSSFAMYATTLAFAYALEPSSMKNKKKTLFATMLFATGAIVGWPFALALSLPFVFEELFVHSGDQVNSSARTSWMISRWKRFFTAGLASALIFVPVVAIDSTAYGQWSIVPWNIVRYNIFGGSDRGPDLYGTAPWYFYIFNLLLNFNVLVPLAFVSLPCLAVTYRIDRKRLEMSKPRPDQSSPFTLLALRLAPLYVWTAILTAQAHKEERFMFPAYPLICFNAAVTLYLIRGWMEVAYISATNSSYQASRSIIFGAMTCSVVVVAGLISLSRVLALWHYYHAPLSIFNDLEAFELPRLLNVTGLLPPLPPGTDESDAPSIDLTPIREFDLRLCLGKEWYRFPGHYLVPNGVKVGFVKSEFDGLLPAHFKESRAKLGFSGWWDRPGSRITPTGLNDLNKEASEFYVPIESCDYFVDLDFPMQPALSLLEPRYAIDHETWERVSCHPFLDASRSSLLTRTLWLPVSWWQRRNEFGDYCLLKNRDRVYKKEVEVAARVQEERL
ncbi:glycosyltransferase family 22 protein [Rhizopogon vinicolor AM-OR11-026]|uniref:Mannosyltransferase n=1 Tax=Rhizopogon vinicolor AM-OR11-026 TaxID=1314800 RepID=A0A1B7MJS3_9AGAM|nr:glycosyltransferase family 22 protein [Rhizopogon vinicolor AM-OR11-026]